MKDRHLYKFGEFTLCAEDHTLTRGDQNIPLTPKMFDLLLVLVQNPGRVLGKEFLLQSVWPDSFVEEGNITFNIRQLRKALDDDAQAPVFIETIPRRGYRFITAVEGPTTVTSEDDSTAPDRPAPPPEPPRSRRYVFLTVGTALLLGTALAIGGWFLNGRAKGTLPLLSTPFSSQNLSTDGSVFHIAISQDGKNVVYTHTSGGKQSVWLRQLETSNNVQIIQPSDDFYGGLAISPDGNTIYFARGSRQGPQLAVYRMSIFGGVPQKVVEQTQGWISIGPKGDKLSFVRCPYTDEDYCSLYVADTDGGQNERKLLTRPRPFRIGDNKISPDGKTVAIATGQSRTSSNEFTAVGVDIETGAERLITSEKFFNINYFAWSPNHNGLFMTAMQLPDRHYRIWQVSPSGETVKLTSDSVSYSRLGVDSQGSALVSTQVKSDFRLMIYQTDNPTAPPRVVGDANTVAFAPDGTLYYSSARTGDSEIWSVGANESDQRQLTNDPAGDIVPMLSHDGKSVFFQSDRSGTVHTWRMNLDGTNQRQVTNAEGGYPLRVSPDGQWLYYRSALNGTLRRVSIETGQDELIFKDLGRNVSVSPDVTKVAYSQRSNQESIVTVMSLHDQTVHKTFRVTSAPNIAHMTWSDDGRYLAYVLTDDKREVGSLWFQMLDSDSPRQVADLSGDTIAELYAFSLSKDGRQFAVIKGNWKHDAVLFRGLK